MQEIKKLTIFRWEDFERDYSIKNAPEDAKIIFCLYEWSEKEYEKEMEKKDGNIFCIEIDKKITDTLESWEYESRLFLEDKKRRAIASGKITIK